MSDTFLTCADCCLIGCDAGSHLEGHFPDFCVTANLDETFLGEVMPLYLQPENQRVSIAAAEVESENYCRMTRVEEICEFARKMGYRKIGIASCVGLAHEARIAARIFRAHGLEVYGVFCKVGAQKKTSVGIPQSCESTGPNMCNPILQAKLLNREKTDMNVVIGLCVGHDSLFYKYSEALCTTLVTKDRVLGHNPAAALLYSESYYNRLLQPEK